MKKYYPWSNYSMKCQIYPNATQKNQIDTILHGVQVFCNMVSYDMHESFMYTTEKPSSKGDGSVVHFQRLSEARKKDVLDRYREMNPCIKEVPASALASMKCSCLLDIEKQYKRLGEDGKYHTLPVEYVKHQYYSKSRPRNSYTYQEHLSKVIATKNRNVFKFSFAKVGAVKVRGWNQKIRFGENHDMDFLEYAKVKPGASVQATVERDNCGDYFVVFGLSSSVKNGKITGTVTYVPFPEAPEDNHAVGIDMGVTDLAITSDGKKYYNPQFAQGASERQKIYQQKMAKAQGFSNVQFREARKKDKELLPSKSSEKWKLKSAKLSRRTTRRRDNRWNNVTSDIVANASSIYIESLNVKGMMDKETKYEKLGTRRKAARSNFGMSDAAMSDGLIKLKYKANGYGRTIKEIGVTRSTGVCPDCGYTTKPLPTSVRIWTCPGCNKEWDRDIAAAMVIKQKGIALDSKT